MSRAEQLEGEIRGLSPEELKLFRDWFERFDAEAWDRQIEADAPNGRLLKAVEKALHDHRLGRSSPL
jgi:hypothetical protein